MGDKNAFWISDAHLEIRTETADDVVLFVELARVLRSCGMTWGANPRYLKRYRCISKYHKYSRVGDLECDSEYFPAGMRFEFYQNVNVENRNGGKYDFRRVSKMPYLVRLKYQQVLGKLRSHLLSRGFSDGTDVEPDNAYARAVKKRNSWMASHGSNFYAEEMRNSHNITDKDGNIIRDGHIRFMYHPETGRIIKGKAYYNANNQWMLVCNGKTLVHASSHNLFSWREGLPRRSKTISRKSEDRRLRMAFWSLTKEKP